MATTDQSIRYLIALGLIPGVGSILAKQLISYCGSAEAVFRSPPRQLLKIPNIGQKLVSALKKQPLLLEADRQLSLANKQGISVYSYLSPNYPYRLKQAIDSPLVLYIKGTPLLDSNKVLSIVGTRKASPYGQAAVANLLSGLEGHKNLLVVSGLAYGIDIAAHRESLRLGIPTVGVQANGLNSIYPPLHTGIAHQMIECGGGLISEYPLNTKPDAHRFPSRNRIIAGLADVVVVAEARKKGGALITASLANSYNREVCAIPGDIRRENYRGCHQLIRKNQAHLITNASELSELMGWEKDSTTANGFQTFLSLENPEERAVCESLRSGGDQQLDMLSIRTGIPLNKLAGILLQLEFKGLVKPAPGKIFGLAKRL